ncbi:MAG: polysaccharide deacetylase family protein [Candidatus Margulisiibacteriota bacterium]
MMKRCFSAVFILLVTTTLYAEQIVSQNEVTRAIWHGDRGQPRVALTFDDGPKPEFCIPILNVLDQYSVKATFFVIGREARWHPDLVHRIVESGHDIGNHTYSHYRLDSLSRDQINIEIQAANEIIESITGTKPLYFRPPGGRFNRVVLEEIQKNGLQAINWSVNAGDYTQASKYFRPSIDPQNIIRTVTQGCKNGDIILMHNGGGATAEALPRIILCLRKAGFKLVTVSELLQNETPNMFGLQTNKNI